MTDLDVNVARILAENRAAKLERLLIEATTCDEAHWSQELVDFIQRANRRQEIEQLEGRLEFLRSQELRDAD